MGIRRDERNFLHLSLYCSDIRHLIADAPGGVTCQTAWRGDSAAYEP